MAASDLESWHFCDSCSYMERMTEHTLQRLTCPACASPNWPDRSLTRDLVRIGQVISTAIDRKSRSHDEKEERELEFFPGMNPLSFHPPRNAGRIRSVGARWLSVTNMSANPPCGW